MWLDNTNLVNCIVIYLYDTLVGRHYSKVSQIKIIDIKMAGNKINTKKKDDKTKINRATGQSGEENEDDIDFSLLRKPILTSVTGFAQAIKIFDQVTEELKSLLTNECDLLYECKICRNIFRSLANFISHKRVYCKENFNSSVHGHFMKEPCTIQEVLKIRKLEESYQESLNETKCHNSLDENENDERIPMSKDITEVLEKIVKSRGVKEKQIEDQQLAFQKIPMSSVAVFQNINYDDESDSMRTQINELDHILSQENAVLQNDGTLKVQSNTPTDNIIQISDDDENENTGALKCKTCDLQFSTLKTLKFHMKYKHVENRLVFPCPDCADIFSTSWSVFRHLFKVHRKTAAQIRRLRESIQAKAFRMDNPPAFYERRRTVPKVAPPQKITEEERLDQENQAWLEELDGESEGRRCGGCGRTFERRAALVAHSHTCARRHRRRIGIQIRKDYHKEQSNPYLSASRVYEPKPIVEETPPECKTVEKETIAKEINEGTTQSEEEMPTVEERKDEEENKEETETNVENKPFLFDSILMNNLPFGQQAEKSNLTAFKQKMLPDIEREQLICKKCNIKHNEITDLLNHMAAHYKWVRYACKLCNFKHFNFEKLPEHVKIIHKLKGDNDFYYSTVKAVDGPEAMELAETVEESNDISEVSPDSRRPSRCSSDSSRLSDDSSSSSTRLEAGSRKRKANKYRSNAKKKRDMYITEETEGQKDDETQKEKDAILSENDTSSNSKVFEENSSDFDEVDERILKRQAVEINSVASRRPVRKKTKPKNEDFEYDLSNLLKLEAQGYRDSQTVTPKPTQSKKKAQLDLQQNYEAFNKDCCGALVTLSWKSAGKAQSHMKTLGVFASKEPRISTTFVRPMVPKVSRIDKISPKKDEKETKEKDTVSPVKVVELSNLPSPHKNLSKNNKKDDLDQKRDETAEAQVPKVKEEIAPINDTKNESVTNETNESTDANKTVETDKKQSLETPKPSLNVPILPIKFRRQSLEVIKNPLIKKNITDFTKAGMKTKILVIKPINRNNNDGPNSINTPLKFQTIKLKDPTKATPNEEKKDQVVVVQVPKVENTINKTISNNSIKTTTEGKSASSDKDASASYIDLSEVKKIVPESENSGEQICDSKLTNAINEIPIVSQNTANLEDC